MLTLQCAGVRTSSWFPQSVWGPLLALFVALLAATAACGGSAAEPPPASGTVATVVNTEYLPVLSSLLDSAQQSVSVVQYELILDRDGTAIIEHLKQAVRRGVAVAVLLENTVAGNTQAVEALRHGGIQAQLGSAARFTHAKLVVVDGAQVLFGSTNWSAQSLENNNEANFFIQDSALAPWFASYASQLMAASDQTPKLEPLTTDLGSAMKDGDYVGHASAMIETAKRRVQLVVYGMNADTRYSDSDVVALIGKLGAARARGVSVQVLLEISDPDLGVNDINREAARQLRAAGVEVHFDQPDIITHAKVLVCDDDAIVGSNNWGYGGFHTYHEVGLRTRIPSVVREVSRYVDRLWMASTPTM